MLNLLSKDLKLLLSKSDTPFSTFMKLLVRFIFIVLFAALEVILYSLCLKKITKYEDAGVAFTGLFLFVIALIIMIFDLLNASKLFFNEKDIEQLSMRPVSSDEIVLSKLIVLFFLHYFESLIFVYPVFIAYGAIIHKAIAFYYQALFYPILTFFFLGGISLILVYPYYLIKKFLRAHTIMRFIIAILALSGLTYIYSLILNLFISLVSGGNLNLIFTTDSIAKLIALRAYEIPLDFLIKLFLEKARISLFPYLGIAFGFFVLGISFSVFAYNYVRNVNITVRENREEKKTHLVSIKTALIKKEITLLVRNSDYTVSYIGLLIVEPFLLYLVVNALSVVFTSGVFTYYLSLVPNFVESLDIMVVMLFSGSILSGANEYIGMERSTIKLLKTMPVSPKQILKIKVIIPFVLSSIALLVSLIVLFFTKEISIITACFAFLLAEISLLSFTLISLSEELKIRIGKPRNTFFSGCYSYVLPILCFFLGVTFGYLKLSRYIPLLISLGFFLILLLPPFIILKKNGKRDFMDLEAVN